jgi:hypothetical protein
MSETPNPTAISEPERQEPLFGVGPGAYGETLRYDLLSPEPFVMPEKPPKLEDMTAEQMIAVALQDRLIPDIYGHFDDRRRDFIRDHHWTPYSWGEATRAIGGGLVNYLLGARTRGGMSAVRDVLDDVPKDRAQARSAVEDLRLVQDTQTGEFNPEWARGNAQVRQALAREVFARNSLNLFEWPLHYDKTKKQTKENRKTTVMLLALTDKLARLDDPSMQDLLEKTLRHQQARLDFWAKQTDKAETDPKAGDLVAAAKSRV